MRVFTPLYSPQVLRNMPFIVTEVSTDSTLWLSGSSLHDNHYVAESHDKPQRPATIIERNYQIYVGIIVHAQCTYIGLFVRSNPAQ